MMRRHGHFLSLTPERLERVKNLFSRHHEKILLISKATLGFGTSVGTLVILLTAGVSRVSLRKFIILNAAGEVILLSIMLTLGYVFGQFYHAFKGSLAWVSLGGVVLVAAGLLWGFSRYLKNRQLV
jgi:membrane protein DedA with SNARE-associated domain